MGAMCDKCGLKKTFVCSKRVLRFPITMLIRLHYVFDDSGLFYDHPWQFDAKLFVFYSGNGLTGHYYCAQRILEVWFTFDNDSLNLIKKHIPKSIWSFFCQNPLSPAQTLVPISSGSSQSPP